MLSEKNRQNFMEWPMKLKVEALLGVALFSWSSQPFVLTYNTANQFTKYLCQRGDTQNTAVDTVAMNHNRVYRAVESFGHRRKIGPIILTVGISQYLTGIAVLVAPTGQISLYLSFKPFLVQVSTLFPKVMYSMPLKKVISMINSQICHLHTLILLHI